MNKIRKALISVYNKKDLKPLVNALSNYKIDIISSGGTYKKIRRLGFKCIELSKFTNTPEILNGRVKTLHPKIYGGILNKRKNKKHIREIKKNNYENIDLIIANFYPFEDNLYKKADHNKIIENIDIGGPTMVRAAAKNYNDVVVICNPNQYQRFINELETYKGSTSLSFREKFQLFLYKI